MVDECEGAILGKLKAPSTYKQVRVTIALPDEKKHRQEVFIDYDAANDYGVPIRGIEKCEFPYGPEEARISPMDDISRRVVAESPDTDNTLSMIVPEYEPDCCMPPAPENRQ